jgi:hypothetical protein
MSLHRGAAERVTGFGGRHGWDSLRSARCCVLLTTGLCDLSLRALGEMGEGMRFQARGNSWSER